MLPLFIDRIPHIPPAFFQHVVELRVYSLSDEGSTAEQAERIKGLDNSMGFFFNLEILDISKAAIPPSITRLQVAPLREIQIDKVSISEKAMEALSLLIEGCALLESVRAYALRTKDCKRLFEAVLSNRSITSLALSKSESTSLSEPEMTALSALIRESKSLRCLKISHVHLSREQACQFLEALTLSSSLYSVTLDRPFSVATTTKESKPQAQGINKWFHGLLKTNRILQKFHFWCIADIMPLIDGKRELKEAVLANPSIQYFSTRNGDHIYELKKESLSEREQDRAFNLLQTGRVFASSRTVCGHVIPAELLDHILRHYSMDSELHEEMWRIIRRAVMNRGTIGKLWSKEKFNAHELLYLCSLCSRIE